MRYDHDDFFNRNKKKVIAKQTWRDPRVKRNLRWGKKYKLSKGTFKCIQLGMCILYNVERGPTSYARGSNH